jgi:hypothetical protein
MVDASPLLLVFGSGDEVDQFGRSGSRMYVRGSSDLGRLIQNRDIIRRLLVSPEGGQVDFSPYPVIVNMITEAENNAKVLENLRRLLTGVRSRVINPPEAVLRTTRDEVAAMLDGIPGLVVPKTVRLAGNHEAAAQTIRNGGINGPIIVREAGTHTGKSVTLYETAEEAASALNAGQDYIATQFHDFASSDGIYRKYRLFFIGDRMILRHMYASDHWNVHSSDRPRFMAPRPDIVAEERALIERDEPFGPRARAVFQAIRDRMPLDFFGLDFGFTLDGDVLLFEANATMSFFPFSNDPQFQYLRRSLEPAQAAFQELVALGEGEEASAAQLPINLA